VKRANNHDDVVINLSGDGDVSKPTVNLPNRFALAKREVLADANEVTIESEYPHLVRLLLRDVSLDHGRRSDDACGTRFRFSQWLCGGGRAPRERDQCDYDAQRVLTD